MELGITKDKWEVSEYSNETATIVTTLDTNVCNVFMGSVKGEQEANAQLIADAGTTANKFGLLPSEILEQRDELLEALINVVNYIESSDIKEIHKLQNKTYSAKAINNTLNK